MKNRFTYIKDNIITGVIVLVPIIVISIFFSRYYNKVLAVTDPITNKISFGGDFSKTIIAVLLLVIGLGAFFFISGLILKTYVGKSFKNWIEEKFLVKIPFYETLGDIAEQFTGIEKNNYPVVEVDLYGNSNKLIGFMTETLTDGRSIIYIPFSPILSVGQVHIVVKENIKILDISFKDATDIITRIGFETNKVFKKNKV